MQKEIEVNGKKYIIKELTVDEGLSFDENMVPGMQPSKEQMKNKTFEMTIKCIVEPKITLEEFKLLPFFKEGLPLITAVNELNGLNVDFQKPVSN